MSTTQIDTTTEDGQSYDHARYRHGHPIPEDGPDLDTDPNRDSEIDRRESGPIIPDGGIVREPGAGSTGQTDCFRDQYADSFSPGFASGVEPDEETGFYPAQTTFYAREAPQDRQDRFDSLWPIHHGVDGWPSCPIDEVDRGHRIDRARRDSRLACEAVAQSADFPGRVREQAIQRALTIDCRSFSRHYDGINGATIGLGLVAMFDTPSDARESPIWPDIRDVCDGLDVDPEALAEYVFDSYDRGEGDH